MGAVWARLRSEMRARWRAWLGLALMLGVFGGAVMALAAGARRTDNAYPRFLVAESAWDIAVYHFSDAAIVRNLDFDKVAKLPEVAEAVHVKFLGDDRFGVIVSSDPRYQTSFDKVKLLAGRLPAPDSPTEAAVGFVTHQDLHVNIGDTIRIGLNDFNGRTAETVELKVVGIGAGAIDFPPILGASRPVYASAAFAPAHAEAPGGDAMFFRLRHGPAGEAAFRRQLNGLGGEGLLPLQSQSIHAKNVERSFHLQAVALWLMAGFTALGITLIFGQSLARQTYLESIEYPTLRTLGMTRGQTAAVTLLRSLVVAGAGAALAALVAVLASPVFPTGVARFAEPQPGIASDWTVLGVGALAIVVLVEGLAAIPAIRAARVPAGALGTAELAGGGRPSAAAGLLARWGFPSTAVTGLRLALEPGRGRSAVPVRTTLIALTIGIAGLTSALTFDASLGHLLRTPALYGLRWDAVLGVNLGQSAGPIAAAVQKDHDVVAYATGSSGVPLTIGDHNVDAIAFAEDHGGLVPPIIAGRRPQAADEIILGTKTLHEIGKQIGDTVEMSITGTASKPVRIVGTGVTPPVGEAGRFGEGAVVRYDTLLRIVPDGPPPNEVYARFGPGVRTKTVLDRLRRELGADLVSANPPDLPGDLINFGRIEKLPLILAGVISALAAAALAHAMVTSIRRRRRDLAILKTMGFVRRQVQATVAWHATTVAVVGLAAGLPLGILGGRWLWTVLARQLGIVPQPQLAAGAMLAVVPSALVLANLIAVLPGRSAARTVPAITLRTE